MDNVFIRTTELPRSIDEKYFSGTDLATVEDIIDIMEELYFELEDLKERYEDLEERKNKDEK